MEEHTSLVNEKYGEHLQEYLLEQYKLFVKTSLDVTTKRLESNRFHLTLNSIVFGIASYMTILNQYIVIILFSAVGILISYVWRKNILAYKELNKAKFKVIHELEAYLPACLFKCEEKHSLTKYHGLTSTEKMVSNYIYGSLCISHRISYNELSHYEKQFVYNTLDDSVVPKPARTGNHRSNKKRTINNTLDFRKVHKTTVYLHANLIQAIKPILAVLFSYRMTPTTHPSITPARKYKILTRPTDKLRPIIERLFSKSFDHHTKSPPTLLIINMINSKILNKTTFTPISDNRLATMRITQLHRTVARAF